MFIHTYFTNCFTSVESTTVREIQLGSFFFSGLLNDLSRALLLYLCVSGGKWEEEMGADEMDCFGSIIIALHCKTESKWIKHFHS